MTHGSTFSGIGGFDLAAHWMGWRNLFHVEQDEFCRKVLAHHFPNSDPHEDIRTFNAAQYKGQCDILTGGFPCQPFSTAGKRKGTSDARWLWPEMFAAIRTIQPRWVVAENVRGLINMSGMVFDTVCTDLENEGFKVWPFVLPAAGVNAPHKRDRVWIIAHANGHGQSQPGSGQCGTESNGVEAAKRCGNWQPVADGHSDNSRTAFDAHYTGGTGGLGQVQGTNGEVPQRDDHAEPCHPSAADASNTDAVRLQLSENTGEVGRGQSEVRCQGHQPTQPAKATRAVGDATNANRQQLEGRNGKGTPCGSAHTPQRIESPDGPRGWETFPTVAPVCGGDDGLPERLDGITFSKWRRESIKAYGNAIVPQVALQIFRAIEEWDAV